MLQTAAFVLLALVVVTHALELDVEDDQVRANPGGVLASMNGS